jgi:hypothetical protein
LQIFFSFFSFFQINVRQHPDFAEAVVKYLLMRLLVLVVCEGVGGLIPENNYSNNPVSGIRV